MKRYECLFILYMRDLEEGVNLALERITAAITEVGGKVESIQKMDRRTFARVANKKVTSGFYVNLILQCPPMALEALRKRFKSEEDIHRVIITESREVQETVA